VLVSRATQKVDHAVDPEEDFIEMPFVAGPCPAPAEPVGVDLPERRTPRPDGFVADHHAALQHQLLDLTQAQRNR
jgi:hypothetical protein